MSTYRSDPATRVACLTIPSLALASELSEHPGLRGAPVVLTDEAQARVADVTAEAATYGVHVGMPLRDAEALCPTVSVLVPRAALVARAADALVDALGAVSPLVEPVEPGVVLADLRGTEGLYPTAERLHQAVLAALAAPLPPQLGMAGQRFTAIVAAREAAPGTLVEVGSGDEAAFLTDVPVAMLPLPGEAIARLGLLGIRTCGDYTALPRHAVEAQFGFPGGVAWLAARGEDPHPVRPQPWERERVVEVVQSDPPLVSREAILHGLEQMLGRALRHPRAAHRFVRSLHLRCETERGDLWERRQMLKEPLGDRARLWTAIRTLIEYAEFPGPLCLLSLEIGGLTSESGRQRSLLDGDQVRRVEQMDEMVRHLKVRFARSPITRVVKVEPWHRLPERRYGLLEYDP